MKLNKQIKDITNKKFGKLKVLEYVGKVKNNRTTWNCKCECGREKLITSTSLLSGQTKSCGDKKCRPNTLPSGVAALNSVYVQYKNNAKKRNIKFFLTKEEFKKLTKQNCYYCDRVPIQERKVKDYNGNCLYNGIDRKNNKFGYILENCVTCCKHCNSLKSDKISFKEMPIIISTLKKLRGTKYIWRNNET